MAQIQIVTAGKTYPFFGIPEASTGVLDGSSSPVVSLPPRRGYHFNQSVRFEFPAFEFDVTAQGTLDFAPSLDGFVTGRGETTLTVRGVPVEVNGHGLDHSLVLHLLQAPRVSAPEPVEFHLVPAPRYRVDLGGSGVLGHLDFGLTPDGRVTVDPPFAGFAQGGANLLRVHGHRIEILTPDLSHGLLPVGLIGYTRGFLPRGQQNHLVLMPGEGFAFQAGGGAIGSFRFGVTLDGKVTLKPEFSTFATADANKLTVRGHEIEIEGNALSHDLLPIIQGQATFLKRGEHNVLRLMPAGAYRFQAGGGVVGDFHFGVALDGKVVLQDKFTRFATADRNKLTIHGYKVVISGDALSHDLLPLGVQGHSEFLKRGVHNELTLIPANFYRFIAGAGVVGDFHYGVGLDGKVTLEPRFSSFATAVDNTLTIHGHKIAIKGDNLSHDLLPLIRGHGKFLKRGEQNTLTLIPSSTYRFQPGGGVVADMTLAVTIAGKVDYPDSCDRFLGGRGSDTLVLNGYPVVVDASNADSDLLSIVNIGLRAQTPRQLSAVLLPGQGYVPQTRNGVFTHGFNLERDGSITFAPEVAAGPGVEGFYQVVTSSSPNPSRVGEAVTIAVAVQALPPATGVPRGDVVFSEEATSIGRSTLEADGRATFRISTLPAGDHDIGIRYEGDEDFNPSAASVRHRVE